jgi:sulfite reductase beta subunit-like hemoprotein
MGKDKILEQLVAIAAEMRELCAVLRQNTVLTKTNGLLLKRHIARMNTLLYEQGIEKLPDLIEENELLVEQNVILLEQRENDIKSLLNLQHKLDAIHATHADAGHESSAAQAGGG